MRLKITIGINLAEKNPMTGMHMMCIPNIAVLVEFFFFFFFFFFFSFLQSLLEFKRTSKWLYYCMCHINDTVHPCFRKANANRWAMMYMQNAQ